MDFLYLMLMGIATVWLIRKKDIYNPYEEALGNSGYHEASLLPKATCTEEICRLLEEISGKRRLIRDFVYQREILVGRKRRKKARIVTERGEILLIHEAGIFFITSADLEGNIRGNARGRYWIQSFRDGYVMPCRNYISNPFLENKKLADVIRWQCRDRSKLPFYYFAVFGRSGLLETEGEMEENKWALSIRNFPTVIAEVMRRKRKYLNAEEVEEVYRRIMEIVQTEE